MGLTKLDSNRTLSATRQDYVLPVCPVSGATVTYRGDEFSELQTIEIDLSGQTAAITQATSAGFGSIKVLDFLSGLGNVAILNAAAYGPVTTSSATIGASEALLVALGSAASSTNGTLTSTEVTHVPSTSTTMATNAGTVLAVANAVSYADAKSSAQAVHLNFALGANVTGAGTVTLGTGFKVILTYNVAAR